LKPCPAALDTNSMAISSLREHLGTLRCTVGKTATGDALRHLETQPAEHFDVVFLDPPFHQDLLMPACTLLEERNWLADNAWIYTESETAPSTLGMPANWRLHREKKAGQVHYAVWERSVVAS
jgi:16S rRNA (guanine966-N2)-methyltransferase